MDTPVQTQPASAMKPPKRAAWLGWFGIVAAFFGLTFAVLGPHLFPSGKSQNPETDSAKTGGFRISFELRERTADVSREGSKEKRKRGLKDWFMKRPPADASSPETNSTPQNYERTWRFVEFAPLVAGLLGAMLGAGSWIRREDHRVSVAALILSLIALCWHWIALGMGIGAAVAVLMIILSQFAP